MELLLVHIYGQFQLFMYSDISLLLVAAGIKITIAGNYGVDMGSFTGNRI